MPPTCLTRDHRTEAYFPFGDPFIRSGDSAEPVGFRYHLYVTLRHGVGCFISRRFEYKIYAEAEAPAGELLILSRRGFLRHDFEVPLFGTTDNR